MYFRRLQAGRNFLPSTRSSNKEADFWLLVILLHRCHELEYLADFLPPAWRCTGGEHHLGRGIAEIGPITHAD